MPSTPAVIIDEVGRPEPPLSTGEAATLLGFLDFQRATLEWKTRDLDAGQLAQRLSHPTIMTLGGVLKHMAWVEDHWFTHNAAARAYPDVWAGIEDQPETWEWESAADHTPDELRRLWGDAVDRSRAVAADLLADDDASGLASTHEAWGGRARVSLRWILVHMIEEYARHNGHADLLREAVDGSTGE